MRPVALVLPAALALAFAAPAGSGPGPAEEQPDGLLVLGAIDRSSRELAVVADPRTGITRARRLSGGALCHGPVLAVGRRVVFPGRRGATALALSLPLSLRGRPRSLGAAETFVASDVPGRIELRPPRTRVVHAVADGRFVMTRGRWLSLWDRRTRRSVRRVRDGWFLAARGERVAWCGPRCSRVGLWDRGAQRSIEPAAGLRLRLGGSAAFSPDGRRLALPVTQAGRSRVGVLDLANRAWRVIPGAKLDGYESIAWSPSGRWIYFTGGGAELFAWRLGSEGPMLLAVEPGKTVMSIDTAVDPRDGQG